MRGWRGMDGMDGMRGMDGMPWPKPPWKRMEPLEEMLTRLPEDASHSERPTRWPFTKYLVREDAESARGAR